MARPTVLMALLLVSRASAEVSGDLSLLTRLAELQQQNLEAIRQWRGRAELWFHESRSAEDYEFTQTVDVEFAQDLVSDSLCFRWVVRESFARKRGHDDLVNSLRGYQAGALLVGGDFYRLNFSPPEPRTMSVLVSDWTEPIIGPFSQEFYPMTYFRIETEQSEQFFDRQIKFSGEKWKHTHIRQDGERVLLDTGGRRYPVYRGQYIFDLAQNGLLVEFEGRDEILVVTHRQKYQEFSGVFLPVHTVYRNVRHDGSELSEKEVRWKDHVLNEPIPPEAFTLEAMGVPAGAKVIDFRTRRTYRAESKAASTATAAPDSAPEKSTAAPEQSTDPRTPLGLGTSPPVFSPPAEHGSRWVGWLLLAVAWGIVAWTWWRKKSHAAK